MGLVVVDTMVDGVIWAAGGALQAMSCHAGSSMVEMEVPPYDRYEIISLKNTWGELWKPNTTFWDATSHVWWALGTTQVSFSWTAKNTSC